MRPRSLDQFLQRARVPYTTFKHPEAFTAQGEAAVSHVPGRSWAKIVVCIADASPFWRSCRRPFRLDLEQLRVLTGACVIRLASEDEFQQLYPDCEPGAMPPFGNLYLQRVFVDQSLVGETEMAFNAGTHTDAIRMHYADFAELAKPVVGVIGRLIVTAAPAAARIRKRVDSRRDA